jgi:di/tricarboxylate transporter
MSMPGFHWSVMLGFMEVFGVTVCSGLELRLKGFSFARKAPLTAYAFLCLCLMSSSWLSNWALSYINYPTKVRTHAPR